MSATDELRQAAQTLRERAAQATTGPWTPEYSKPSGHVVLDPGSRNALDSVARATHYRDSSDARYIATMLPGVGLALADLLEEALADFRDMGSYETCTSIGSAAREIARLINGGAS